MTETRRSYKVIQAKDGTFGVEISPAEQGAPLIISGFIAEAEALAWIDGERNRITEPPPPESTVLPKRRDQIPSH